MLTVQLGVVVERSADSDQDRVVERAHPDGAHGAVSGLRFSDRVRRCIPGRA